MRSNTIMIDNRGNGFDDVTAEARKVAVYEAMKPEASDLMQLMIDEILSVVKSANGDMQASFWIECEYGIFNLHLNTKTVLNKEMRHQLIASSTSGKNEAANTSFKKLLDRFEQARASEVDRDYDEIPPELLGDFPANPDEDPERDGYERKILQRVADSIKIGILRGVVDVVISKRYA